jgi:hypothetical protein
MSLALTLTFLAVILVIAFLALIPVIMIKKGLGVKYVYDDPPQPQVILSGEVIEEPEEAFFDEHDLAVMEAHKERPEFTRTQVLLNGEETNPDGTALRPEKERSWWRR